MPSAVVCGVSIPEQHVFFWRAIYFGNCSVFLREMLLDFVLSGFLASWLLAFVFLESGLFGFWLVACWFLGFWLFGFSAFRLLAFWLYFLWPLWLWLSASSASPVTPQHHRLWVFFEFLVGGFLPPMFL